MAMAMATATAAATATIPTPTLPSEPEPESHLRESSTTLNLTPISPNSFSDLLSTHSLSTYNCHTCFSPPTNATMTPCGHVASGPCLFTAVKMALRMMMDGAMGDEGGPRCPIRRALIQGRVEALCGRLCRWSLLLRAALSVEYVENFECLVF
ncbi:hypothetical protein DFH05DRAFT_1282626 [Lentinula detonsa]|uniref:Zinc finger C3HC4 RING-type domain-containing protein n=1 Tax=Lentinula detonsa TaxID=2804962 RepID=A0A9W8NXT4_9AGAR|nr:hypothetical protein DFH05DRAFT_1282626 [Lentinula detonsa]